MAFVGCPNNTLGRARALSTDRVVSPFVVSSASLVTWQTADILPLSRSAAVTVAAGAGALRRKLAQQQGVEGRCCLRSAILMATFACSIDLFAELKAASAGYGISWLS